MQVNIRNVTSNDGETSDNDDARRWGGAGWGGEGAEPGWDCF